MFPRLAFALKKTLSFWQRRGKNKFLTQALGLVVEVVGPKGSTFWNVEGIPVVVSPKPGTPIPSVRAFPPSGPPRPPKLPGSLPPRSSAQRVTDRSRASVSRRVSCRARPAPRAGDFAHSAGGSEASRPIAARWSARRSAGPRGYCSDIDGATLHASMNF
jgi:hypothetical protein